MKLEKIKICNFRSFSEEQEIRFDDFTTIIGNNSAGKTTALSALNLMFSQVAAERVLKRSDFHVPKNQKPEEIHRQDMYIEAVLSFDEVKTDECDNADAIPLFFNSMVVPSQNASPILRIRLNASWERSSNIEGSIESKICYITCPECEEITEDNMHPAPRKDLDFIRVIYVPAVRDPSKQLKNVSGTMIHQILNSVRWSDSTKDGITKAIDQLNSQFVAEKGVSILNDSIHNQWGRYDSDSRYSNAVLRFNSTDIESSMKNSEVYFSPTVTEKEYTIDEMGDGLRSLFYISMVNTVLEVETKITESYKSDDDNKAFSSLPPVLTIVAIEEPENHISPQLLGKLIGNLKSISEKSNAQVAITSHSSAIVKRVEPESLRYFRMSKNKMNTVVKEITLPSYEKLENQYKFIKEAVIAYPEIYFANLVILGEGDSEEIILPKYIEAYGNTLDEVGISVVPLGGRYVNHFWRLLENLEIPYITLLDLDREREGGGWGRIKYAIKQLLEYGTPKEELLLVQEGKIMSDNELDGMHTWTLAEDSINNMNAWLNRLENYKVYFSSPLDIDFLMLECLGDKYINILEGNQGPKLSIIEDGYRKNIAIATLDKSKYIDEYQARIQHDVHCTLKEEGGDGNTYTDKQKELMIWYNYFFLNRGKPTTHVSVLSRMNAQELKENTPEVIYKIIEQIGKSLDK